jgi:hypothetical protein
MANRHSPKVIVLAAPSDLAVKVTDNLGDYIFVRVDKMRLESE